MAASKTEEITIGETGTKITIESFTSKPEDVTKAVDLALFRTCINLDATKISNILAKVGNLKLETQQAHGGVAAQVVIDDLSVADPVTRKRVEFIRFFSNPVNGAAAPHTVLTADSILQIPAAGAFREASLKNHGHENDYAMGFLLLVTVALISTQNLTVEAFTSQRAHDSYSAILKASATGNWTAAGSVVNAALQKKTREKGVSAPEVGMAAGLYSMTTWIGAALLSNSTVAGTVFTKSANFISEYLRSPCKKGMTSTALVFHELRESKWLTTEEAEAWEEYGSSEATLGSFQIPGSPLSALGPNIIRELKTRISAKNSPGQFVASNRSGQMERFKATLPVFRVGGRRAGGLWAPLIVSPAGKILSSFQERGFVRLRTRESPWVFLFSFACMMEWEDTG